MQFITLMHSIPFHSTVVTSISSHDQDTIHAEKGCSKRHTFHMTALIFLTGHGIKARTHACVEITYLPTRCIIRTRKALSLQSRASQAMMMHLIGNFRKGIGSCYIDTAILILIRLVFLTCSPSLYFIVKSICWIC